jgi:tetratricopeptide (TPR) repeat protein
MANEERIEVLKAIDLYIRGELSQKEIDELWKKFLQSPEYYELFETELHLRSLIKQGKKPDFESNSDDSPKFFTLGSYKYWLFAAAAVVILAICIQLFSMDQREVLQQMALSEIDKTELMGADVARSDESDSEKIDVAINQALAIAYDDQPGLAIEHFQQILEQPLSDQQRIRVKMNLGILHYNLADYESARKYFFTLTEREDLRTHVMEKSWWFLGNTYLNLGNLHDAHDAVSKVYGMDVRFRASALELLKRLEEELDDIPVVDQPAAP